MNESFVKQEQKNIILAVVSGISLVLSLGGWLRPVLPFDIAWVAIVLCGIPIVVGAVKALITEHDIKADVLVSIALVASVAIGEYFAAGEVAFIMAIGTLLEDGTASMTRKGVANLIRLTPRTARVLRDGREQVIPAEEVAVGETVSVLAGETIPADGVVLEGRTAIDQSVMTGESIPVDVAPGDGVTSGTVNQGAPFTFRATHVGADSSLSRMIRLAEQADAGKAPIVRQADRWATMAVWVALACAAVTWAVTGQFVRAVTVLVVFCPCAFILATPTAVMAGIGNASRKGILIRSGDGLERFAHVKTLAFDKTGTLTEGKPAVTAVVPLDDTLTSGELLGLTASAEAKSEHPLGKAIVRHFTEDGGALKACGDFVLIPGQGLEATVEGRHLRVGKEEGVIGKDEKNLENGSSQPVDAAEGGDLLAAGRKKAAAWQDQGATVIWVAIDGRPAGFIALSDTLRPDAPAMVAEVRSMDITPALLTGDHRTAAQAIAGQAGVEEIAAELLPEEKLARIKKLEQAGSPVCMVGDGINDALALRSATAGIAMGGVGSDIAVESSDAVLVSDELSRIPYLLRLSRRTLSKIRNNIVFAMSWNMVAVVLSAMGILNPVWGALVHNFGSVAVVISSACLLGWKDDPDHSSQSR